MLTLFDILFLERIFLLLTSDPFNLVAYLAILGGSLKKIAKKMTISVPVNRNT